MTTKKKRKKRFYFTQTVEFRYSVDSTSQRSAIRRAKGAAIRRATGIMLDRFNELLDEVRGKVYLELVKGTKPPTLFTGEKT